VKFIDIHKLVLENISLSV